MKYQTPPDVYEYASTIANQEHRGEISLHTYEKERIHFLEEATHRHLCSQIQTAVVNLRQTTDLLPILTHRHLI